LFYQLQVLKVSHPAPRLGRSRPIPSSSSSLSIPFSSAARINRTGTKRCSRRQPRSDAHGGLPCLPTAAGLSRRPKPSIPPGSRRLRHAAAAAASVGSPCTPGTAAGEGTLPVPPVAGETGTGEASATLCSPLHHGQPPLPRSARAGHRAMSRRPRRRDTRRMEPKPQSSDPAPGEGSKIPSPPLGKAEAQAAPRLPPHGETPEPHGQTEGDFSPARSPSRRRGDEKLGEGVNQSERPSQLPTQGLPGEYTAASDVLF